MKKIKVFSVVLCLALVLAGCNNTQKGAAIGTAVMAPLAYAADKSIKNRNEKINRSRRGKKDKK